MSSTAAKPSAQTATATAAADSTASSTSTSSQPTLPARPMSLSTVVPTSTYSPYGTSPYMSGYGNSPYSGGMYGGGMYGSPGMYGGGMPGGPMYGRNPSTDATFQLIESFVAAVSGLSHILNSTYLATHSSFLALLSLAHQFSSLRNSLGYSALGFFALFKWAKKDPGINAKAFEKFNNANKSAKRKSVLPLLIFFTAVVGFPYLLNKIIKALYKEQEQQQLDPKKVVFCRALYDFIPENKQVELELRKGDLVAVMSKMDPSGKESEWWKVRTRDGRNGYVPSTYLEIIQRRIEPVKEEDSKQEEIV